MTAHFELPDPRYPEQQQALITSFEHGSQAVAILRDNGMETEADRLSIRALIELSNRAYTMARTLGVQAIAEGRMSRVGVSQELGVHQATVAKWVKQAQAEPDRNYVEEPLSAIQYHADRQAS
jgi:hypothetical protein